MACSALSKVDLYGPPTLHYVYYAKYDRVSMSYEDYTQKVRAPQKKLLRFTDNGAKSPSSSGTVTATWYLRVAALARFLEASLTMRQPGMHKIENLSTFRR